MFERGTFVNPIDVMEPPTGSINFATGAVAKDLIEKSLMGALERGEKLAIQFVKKTGLSRMEMARHVTVSTTQ